VVIHSTTQEAEAGGWRVRGQHRLHSEIRSQKEKKPARHWWLMPVILATQEAEIRRILVQSQPGQTDRETLSQKTLHKKGLVEWFKKKKKKPEKKKKNGENHLQHQLSEVILLVSIFSGHNLCYFC
jgi:hypothetical protein